jgi:hypothetical protein
MHLVDPLCNTHTTSTSTPEAQVPAALCAALTGGLVCAGYVDGELRVWPCAGLHLAALQQVAADMGCAPLQVSGVRQHTAV